MYNPKKNKNYLKLFQKNMSIFCMKITLVEINTTAAKQNQNENLLSVIS